MVGVPALLLIVIVPAVSSEYLSELNTTGCAGDKFATPNGTAFVTVALNLPICHVFPLEPFTVRMYVPFVTDGATFSASGVVTKPLDGGVIGFVANVPVMPAGGFTSDKVTGEWNPDTDVTFTVDDTESPCTTTTLVALIMKLPGGNAGVTVSASVVL